MAPPTLIPVYLPDSEPPQIGNAVIRHLCAFCKTRPFEYITIDKNRLSIFDLTGDGTPDVGDILAKLFPNQTKYKIATNLNVTKKKQ